MKAKHFVALLRGINVGGKNIVPMARLKQAFEDLGFSDIATYIQSGNVLFATAAGTAATLTATIEAGLAEAFGYPIRTVVISAATLRAAVAGAPPGFGAQPDLYRYDVIFLKPPLTAAKLMKVLPVRSGVDAAHAGKGVVYYSRLIELATRSHLTRLTQMPVYQDVTIRNWNTTTKLLAMLHARGG